MQSQKSPLNEVTSLERQAIQPATTRNISPTKGLDSKKHGSNSSIVASQIESKRTHKVENRDHCNACKDGGELICCDNCPRSFHVERCLQRYCKKHGLVYEDPAECPDDEWFCPRCRPLVEKRHLDSEEKRHKALLREQAAIERKKKQEEITKERKEEFERRREEKRKEKEAEEAEKIKQRETKLKELQSAREEKEKKLLEEKLEKERVKEQEKKEREEKLAEEKRQKQERIEAEKQARQEKQEAEAKRKLEAAQKREADKIARQAEQEKLKAEKEAERIQKEAERNALKEQQRLQNIEKQKGLEFLKGAGIQTKLNLGSGQVGVIKPGEMERKVINGQLTLSAAEKDKLRKQMLIQSQLQVFKKHFPTLMEKNTIKYPIDDKLILKMPELHGSLSLKTPPNFKSVLIEAEEFENLLYIWEFFNNFSDFLNIPTFSLVELQAALSFSFADEKVHTAFEQEIDSSQEITSDPFQGYNHTQVSTICAIRDQGFHLINQIHVALINSVVNDLEIINRGGESSAANKAAQPNVGLRSTQNQSQKVKTFSPPDDQENALLIHSIMKLNVNKEISWTELVRLLIIHPDERLDMENDAQLDENSPFYELLNRVGAMSPKDYTWSLSYKEKVDLLLFLVDKVHDLDSFRQFLNRRLEDKSKLFKQKNDLHAEIKKIEQEKTESQAKFATENNETDTKEIDELQEKLLSASRTESKWINNRIYELQKTQNKMQNEQARFDDQIAKKHQKIEKVMEQYHGLNIKTSVLGQDAHMNEYWFFKDDPMRLFVKRLVTEISEEDEKPVQKYKWFFIDKEDHFEQFFDSLNLKGIREKKLIESLKKVRLSLKMKKSKKQEEEEQDAAPNEDEEMDNEESKTGDKHHLFENDDYEQSIIDSVWFNKTMPKRRVTNTRGGKSSENTNSITLDHVKKEFLDIEALYSNTMKDLNREWDTPEIRESILEEVRNLEEVEDFYKILDKVENCFSDPFQVTYKKILDQGGEDEEMKDEENEDQDQQNKLSEIKGDTLIKRKKIQLFKFWPKHVLRQAWKKYLSLGESTNNVNCAYLAVQVLDKVTEQFVLNCIKKLDKKAAKFGQQLNKQEQEMQSYSAMHTNSRAGGRSRQQAYDFPGQATNRYNKQADYTKYFASSSDEDEYGEQDDEEVSAPKSRTQRAAERHMKKYGAPEKEEDDEEVSVLSGDEEQEEEDEEEEQEVKKSSRRGRPSKAESNLRASRSSARRSGSRLNSRGPSAQTELLNKFAYKAPTSMTRQERARMRNLKRGGLSSEESDNAEMRDDQIAEDQYGEESGSVIEDDKKNLEEESSEGGNFKRNTRGRKRRAVY